MASGVMKKVTTKACLSCPLCDHLLRNATTISECLHTFCKTCIHEKITEDKIKCCPVCSIDLGGSPLEKLRPDHILQHLRAKLFPLKQKNVKAPEIVSLPSRRKERSISSFLVSTPMVSAQAGTTGKRTKAVRRKYFRGYDSLIERIMKKDESSFQKELIGRASDIILFEKECCIKALLEVDHSDQENMELC